VSPLPDDLLDQVARAGKADSGGVPVELLGDFLPVLVAAVEAGRPLTRGQLRGYRAHGDAAAQQGVALRPLLDLYLSCAWRLWRYLPPVADAARSRDGVVVAGEIMLHAADDVVAALAEGYQRARRSLVAAQVSARRELVDDLLSGSADVVSVLRRSQGFGLDLVGPHAVAVVRAQESFTDTGPLMVTLEQAVQGSKGDAQTLLASKQGELVVVFSAPDRAAVDEVVDRLGDTLTGPRRRGEAVRLSRRALVGEWRLGVGRVGSGVDGVLGSYRDARDSLDLAARLRLPGRVADAADLMVYRLLLGDRAALSELVESTLGPLRAARGGAGPLVATVAAYLATGGNAARTARDLHLSVRAVTYRLDRVVDLTGLDPDGPQDRFALQVAVLGAQLVDWPDRTA
jgi:sugar diacid utilization regulator